MKACDETANLPELWRIFNVHYVASANFTGLFSLFHQLSGPTFVQKNLLTEFVRQNDLQKRIVQLKYQQRSQFIETPAKNLFQSPFLRRTLEYSTPEKSTLVSDSAEGGDFTSSEEDSSPVSTDSEKPRLLEGEDEWRRVMTSLFNMIHQKEHGTAVHKFIKDHLLREKDQSVFDLTEEQTYASLKMFIEFRQPPTSNFKTMSTGVRNQTTFTPCGQSECSAKRTQHSSEDCWVLHPEKKAEYDRKRNPTSPNDSTSAKKNPKGLRRAGQGKNRDPQKNGAKAKQALKRIKTYLTKNNVFTPEDITHIMKGEETEDFQADSTPNSNGGKKRARNVTVNALAN